MNSISAFILTLFSPLISLSIALFTLFWSLVVVLGTYIGDRSWVDRTVQLWGQILLWMARVKVQVKGLENIPSGGILFVFNHLSIFDIPVAHATLPKSFRFGAKVELFSIPIFSWAMRRAGALPIARHDRSRVMKVYEQAIERSRRGESFILAPEGTRQSSVAVGPFKTGPFVFAIKAQCPVVPVVIKGAHSIVPKGALLVNFFRREPITLQVLPAFSTQGLTLDDRDELRNRVREVMVRAFEGPPIFSEPTNFQL